ncbi:SPOR domain-containing protein [Roseibium sp. SCPC15]|uniref:SPOR domain-containing protein n=1 Tax=Roseibium sp. SCP15 TaxID=3141376 RepID=UPI00333B92EB
MEDPLVELARIVHKNKQSGANVSSGRVGSTDYFADLDDFSGDDVNTADSAADRVEPSFANFVGQPETDGQSVDSASEPIADITPTVEAPSIEPGASGQTEPFFRSGVTSIENPEPVETEPPSSNVSPLWPKAPEPQSLSGAVSSAAKVNVHPDFGSPVHAYQVNPVGSEQPDAVATVEETGLAPSVSLDLEQNLTAELEDELIGAFRQSVDDETTEDEKHWAPHVPEERDLVEKNPVAGPQPVEHIPEISQQIFPRPTVEIAEEEEINLNAVTAETAPQPVAPPVEHEVSGSEEQGPATEAPVVNLNPQTFAVTEAISKAKRPTIDENDLFAALNPAPVSFDAEQQSVAQPEESEQPKPAGIDALFADLEFPDPAERKTAQTEAHETVAETSASEIDDMTWPAAAEAVPQTEEDETPPPPEGYDLDAVARAMQESDPSLTGAGVLPPHPSAEEAVVPQAKEKSRRGMFVAAGVLGVAVLGGAGFFLYDGGSVQVPSGPPPIISGLQEPLKVFPEQSQAQTNDSASKLIYDRVDGTSEIIPGELILPETPQPAELPPAPAGSDGSAELVPGSPKRVTTYKVLPDGTIVSESDASTRAAGTQTPTPTPTPVTTADAGTPRVVATTPSISGDAAQAPDVSSPEPVVSAPAEPSVPGTQAEPAPVLPGASDTPAIVADETPVQPAVSEPVAPVPSVLPRKKPAAPVQVASAPVTQTAPAPIVQNDGPLNLSQPASTQAPAPAATSNEVSPSGNIPSGTYIVQVTSQRSASAASDAYAGLQRRYPSILGNRNAVIVPADLGDRGVFYRARIPTGSRDEANSLCQSLQGAGGDCFVRRQP